MSAHQPITRRDLGRLAWHRVGLGTGLVAGMGGLLTGCGRDSIQDFLARTVPRGASLAVSTNGGQDTTLCRGFGLADRGRDIAVDCDTVFDIGSVTKQFTAAAILHLEAAGELAVRDPLSAFVDGLPTDKREITLHQLLTHTAGLIDTIGPDHAPLSRAGMLDAFAASRSLSAPGTRYRYSNLGYSVLAAVIELVSGTGYERCLATRLFTPAGMRDTGYLLPDWTRSRVAMQYDGGGRERGTPLDLRWDHDGPYWNLRGNGGILSTARDMRRWAAALRGTDVLPARARDKLFRPYVLEQTGGDTHYGYGWVIQRSGGGRTVAWHNGGNSYSYTEFALSVDERPGPWASVFWVTNAVRRNGRWNLEDLDLATELHNRMT